MFAAFDVPQPFTTIGRRNVSNVPTQALTMMNDPFVLKQADAWADASLEDQSTESENRRIERLYHRAFAREPLSDETTSAREFLEGRRQRYLVRGEAEKAERLAWRDLCHAVYNTKEFIFLF